MSAARAITRTWRVGKYFDGRYVRTSVYREIGKMVDAGLLVESGGVVALPGRPKVDL